MKSPERIRRRLRDPECGQSLPIIIFALFVVLAMAAAAIDVSAWYQKHHQAQVSADAAALAAANCLATSKCTSTAAGGDAYRIAANNATTNGVPANRVTITNGYVTVTTATRAPVQFAGVFGLHPTASASAVASYNRAQTPASIYGAGCTNPSLPPASTCTVACSPAAVTIQTNGNTNITGAIQTNGSLDISQTGNNTTLGDLTYGDPAGANCGYSPSNHNPTLLNGPPQEETSFTPYIDTYNGVWTSSTSNSCSSVTSYAPGASGFAAGAISFSGTNPSSNIAAAVTISGNVGSTTNPVVICAQSITFAGNQDTLTDVTIVSPSITIPGNGFNGLTITPDPSATPDASSDNNTGQGPAVAIYYTGTSTFTINGNNTSITGAVYAPLAEVALVGNNAGPALLEANQVLINGNNTAGGPTQTLPGLGSDFLVQ